MVTEYTGEVTPLKEYKGEVVPLKEYTGEVVSNEYSSDEYEKPKKKIGAFGQVAGAIAEPVAALASSLIAKPASDIAGLAATGYEMVTGGENADQASGFKERVQQELTYEPRTMAGRSSYNPLNAIPMAIGKIVGAVTPERSAPGEAATLAGAARNIASEAIPQAIGIAGAKYAPKAATPAQKVAKSLRKGAEDLMQSALKPTPKDLLNGKAAQAIDTMLEKGIPATPKGLEQIRTQIEVLNSQIKDAIATSPERVETRKLMRPVVEKLRDFKRQVNPEADVNSIKKSWNEFKNHPLLQRATPEQVIPGERDPYTGLTTSEKIIPSSGKDDMPVQTAQALKQGTYKQLAKKYGQLGSAEVEAQKAIARGLKEQVAAKVPEVAPFNLEESKLLNVLSVAERRIVMEANKNPMGLSLLAKNPKAWAAFMADRSAAAKSLLAQIMDKTSKKLTGEKASSVTKAGSVIAPTQTDRETRKQYEMSQHSQLETQ